MRQSVWVWMLAALLGLGFWGCSDGGAPVADGDVDGDYDPWDGSREDGDEPDGDEDGDEDWERWEEGEVTYDRLSDEPFAQWQREIFEGSSGEVPRDVTAIQPWVNGGAYFGGSNGLWRYNPSRPEGQRLYKVTNPTGVTDMSIIAMVTGENDSLFILMNSPQTDNQLVWMRYEDELRLINGCIFNHSPTTLATKGESRWLYIGTRGPTYFYNGTDCTTAMTTQWPSGDVRSLSGTRDGRMALLQRIATTSYDGFHLQLLDDTWFDFPLEEGLAESPRFYAVHAVDHPELSGNREVWVAHNAGLFRLNNWRELGRFSGGVCEAGQREGCGLPWDVVNHVTVDKDGVVWAATARGVIRRPAADQPWRIFHSRRWLQEDESRVVGFDPEGNVWVGHSGGLTRLYRQSWTLKEKADHIQAIHDARHLRMGGFSVPVALSAPGYMEGYTQLLNPDEVFVTALYALSQTFRGAIARDENDRVAGTQNAWNSLRMMIETIEATSYTELPDLDGLPARAILPRGEGPVDDPEAGPWNRSSQYDWLGAPDQFTVLAHVLAYGFYYDLLADAPQKSRLRGAIKRLADHLLRHNDRLVDVDGEPCPGGRYDPETISGGGGSVGYGGVTALQYLALLRVAHHLTGEARYLEAYLDRGIEKGYLGEVRHQKIQSALRRGDSVADLLAYLAYLVVLRYEDRMTLRDIYLQSLDESWRIDRDSGRPLVGLVYGVSRYSGFDLEGIVQNLRAQPSDLVDWRVDSCWRKDLARAQAQSPDSLPRLAEPLPPGEQMLLEPGDDPTRCVWSFDEDPDRMGGRLERTGVSYLLPYWLARAYRMLDHPGY